MKKTIRCQKTIVFSSSKNLPLRYFFQSSMPFSSQENIFLLIVSCSLLRSRSSAARMFWIWVSLHLPCCSVSSLIVCVRTRFPNPIELLILEETKSIANFTPSTTFLCQTGILQLCLLSAVEVRSAVLLELLFFLNTCCSCGGQIFPDDWGWLTGSRGSQFLEAGARLVSSEDCASSKLKMCLSPLLIPPSDPIFSMKSQSQPILCTESLVSILSKRFATNGDISQGNVSFWVLSTSINLAMELDMKGQCPKIISYSTTPNDQISDLLEQTSPLMTSGAMQMGDPSMVRVISSADSRFLQNPKSPSLMTPSWKKILSGFRSLCMILYLLRTLKAYSSSPKILRAFASCSLPSLVITWSKVPPLQYQQMKQKLLVVFSISQQWIMCWFVSIFVRMLIQFTVHSSSFLFSRNFVIGITFTAYSFWSLLFIARYTLPYTPDPTYSYRAQFSMYLGMRQDYYQNDSQPPFIEIKTNLNSMDDSNPALIVDNGSGFIKVGVAGDDAPKSCFPTIIGRPKQPGQMVGMDQKDIYIGHEVTSKEGVLTLSRPIVDGVIENWQDMEKMWHHGFFNQLQMSPEDSPILLTETPGNTKKSKETMIQLMFEKFQVSSFYLALQQVLALYASGKTTGIVVDSGYSLTSTVPIYQGFALSHAIQKMNLAGKHLTEYLMSLMKEEGTTFSNIEETARFNAKDTKEKTCYVATDYEGSLKEYTENSNKSIVHRLPDGNEISLRSQVFKCPEALFQPSKIVGKQLLGVHQLTFQSILKCDSDIRKDIYGNIVIAGGTSMLKNLNDRLKKELIALAPSTMKINVFDPPERKYSSWMGGSILASLSSFHPMFITKQEYSQGGSGYVHRKCF